MKKLSVLFVLIAGSLWGTMGLFVHWLESLGFSSFEAVSLRLVSAALIMSVVVAVYDRSLFRIRLRDIWLFILLGFMSMLMMTVFYFAAIVETSMSVAAILLYTAPIFVMIASLLLFGEKLTLKKAAALLLAVIGCAFVSGGIEGTVSAKGVMTGILSGICYASYSIFGTILLRRGYHPFTLTVYAFIFAALGSFIFAPPWITVSAFAENGKALLSVAGMFACGAVTAVFPFMFYTTGLKGLQAGTASIIASVEPLMASLLGFAVYGELPGFVGIVMILAAVVLLNVDPKHTKSVSE